MVRCRRKAGGRRWAAAGPLRRRRRRACAAAFDALFRGRWQKEGGPGSLQHALASADLPSQPRTSQRDGPDRRAAPPAGRPSAAAQGMRQARLAVASTRGRETQRTGRRQRYLAARELEGAHEHPVAEPQHGRRKAHHGSQQTDHRALPCCLLRSGLPATPHARGVRLRSRRSDDGSHARRFRALVGGIARKFSVVYRKTTRLMA